MKKQKLTPVLEMKSIDEVCKPVINMLKLSAKYKRVDLKYSKHPSLSGYFVWIDEVRVQ